MAIPDFTDKAGTTLFGLTIHPMKQLSSSHETRLTRRIFLCGGVLLFLLGSTGCSYRITAIGKPERVGNFSIQKFHIVRIYDTGNTESDYYEISHGRFFSTTLGLPPYNWTTFDRITRLPSKSLAWLVEASTVSALITERDGNPVVDTLWRGDDQNAIQAISATRWHIPDYERIERFPAEIYTGGHIFDGVTLTRKKLPNQPPDREHQFIAVSPDDEAVAWFRSNYVNTDTPAHSYSIWVTDVQGVTGPSLTLSESFLKRNPPPDSYRQGETWQAWLNTNFTWRLDEKKRWGLFPNH